MITRREFLKDITGGSMALLLPSFTLAVNSSSIVLNGNWQFRLDPDNKGIVEGWHKAKFVDAAQLPGSLQSQHYGNAVTADTNWWDGPLKGVWKTNPLYEKYRQPGKLKIYEFLQPVKHYLGAAWYSKEVTVPQNWKEKRVLLRLERVHWKSTVFVNGQEAGSQMYLGTEHEYEIGAFIKEGVNTITIRVDNSRLVNVGDMPHCISEQTQGTWNGIIGKMELFTTDKVWIDDVQVYPDIVNKKIVLDIQAGNEYPHAVKKQLTIKVDPFRTITRQVTVAAGGQTLRMEYAMPGTVQLWDEHHPFLYLLSVNIGSDQKQVRFGMRQVSAKGTQVAMNGKPIHIRGNVDCAIFPIHGYPYMDIDWWKKLWSLYKEWGMNLVRFHSWCPPEAAFAAADAIGVYLQPECGDWSKVQTEEQFAFYKKESEAILKRYGNHPSFIMFALGNEMNVKQEYLLSLFSVWKKDGRRLYTGKTGGSPLLNEADYYVGGASKKGTRARYYLGWPPKPGPSYFYQFAPATTRDYKQVVNDDPRPFISHEIAQRCSYPDVINLPKKFTGSLQPTYLDIARDQLSELGMLNQVNDFVQASGKWQVEMYKEEIEANLRTPGIGGFHLLSLQDFPGQGTAPVGFMDFFYDPKPYVKAADIRRFCNTRVVLARMEKRTWFNNEQLTATVDVYNYSGKPFSARRILCTIKNTSGEIEYHTTRDGRTFPEGVGLSEFSLEVDLQYFQSPAKYNLQIMLDDVVNDWDFWIYPHVLPSVETGDLFIAEKPTEEVLTALNNGRTVLLLPQPQQLKEQLVQCFGTFYWTAFDFHGGESSACGLLTDPSHPVFNHFPTDFHGNWQWWELLTKASPVILDAFGAKDPWPKDYRPLIQMIPSWKVNRKLAVLAEAKLGKGKLMLCSMDIVSDLDKRKVAAQFRYSLLKYLSSDHFNPVTNINVEMLRELYV